MTLDYKILWIDDRDDFFKNHEDFIKEHIEDKGFDAYIVKHKSLQEYLDKDNSKTEQVKYDLFLIDLNLDNGNTGDEIIEKIRSNRVLTDIVFYSTNLADVRQSICDNKIEGVFVTSRNQDDFEEKVTDVIDVTIKKVQDVNNLRGLIMAEVAELDIIKNRIVKKHCKITKNSDNMLKKYIKTNVFSDFKSKLEKYNFLISEDESSYEEMDLYSFIDDQMYMSTKKSQTVFKIKRSHKTTKSIDFIHQNYFNDVIKKRNVFAHETEQEDEQGKYLNYSNGDRLDFTEEHCVEIRKDIKKYKRLLEEIEQKLNE
jgi:CheY-like chemotaxis protein